MRKQNLKKQQQKSKNQTKKNVFTIITYEDYSKPHSYHMLQLITSFLAVNASVQAEDELL